MQSYLLSQYLFVSQRSIMADIPVILSSIPLIILLFLIKLTNSQNMNTNTSCFITEDRYTTDSKFHKNLLIVLSNLTSAAKGTNSTFYNSSYGENSDTVYGLYLCRGDLNQKDCSSCIESAAQNITKECPNQKESIKWIPECMLRYANRNIFSKKEVYPSYIQTISNATKPPTDMTATTPVIEYDLEKAINNLIDQTVFCYFLSPTNPHFFSKRTFDFNGSWFNQTIYALAQCTPDINKQMCQECLAQAHAEVGIRSLQAVAYFPSCHLRIDLENFFYSRESITIPQSGPEEEQNQRIPLYIPIGIASAVATLLLFGFCIMIRKRKAKPASNTADDIITMESLQFDDSTIKAAVDNFSESNKLGRGGFGEVYKGTLKNGQMIAVKRLSPESKQGIQEFKTEVLLVAKLQHKNLVRLLGYCAAGKEMLLIYEYLQYSSLDKFLFDPEKRASLDWEKRYKIIDGIAKGLLYLHEESRYNAIHRDLKPSNILLDRDMTPKISDFGLAKLFRENEAQGISNRIVGTHGYMTPEYIRSGNLSVKSDIYSFGVLILEMVSGKRIRSRLHYIPEDEEGLLQYAWRVWNSGQPLTVVDPELNDSFSVEEATRCIHIGLLCTQEDPERRPTMASIVSLLSSYSSILPHLPMEGSIQHYGSSPEGLGQFNIIYSGEEDITVVTGR